MKKHTCIYSLLLMMGLAIFTLNSCKKDDNDVEKPTPINEEELITTFKITFTDTAGIQPDFTATFRDLDGAGGNAPTLFDTIRLKANTVYRANIDFLNESVNPVDSITNEILEEAANHLLCFNPSNVNASIVRTDSDGTYELGLQSLWTLGVISNGNIIISLKHQPGVKDGTCDVGETDIELDFVFKIE